MSGRVRGGSGQGRKPHGPGRPLPVGQDEYFPVRKIFSSSQEEKRFASTFTEGKQTFKH